MIDCKLHEQECESTLVYFEKLRRREMFAGADWDYLSSFLPHKRPDMTKPANPDILSAIRIHLLNKEKQHTSAGHFIRDANNTANIPTANEAAVPASMMCSPHKSGLVSM